MRRHETLVLVSKNGAAISVSPDACMLFDMQKREPGSRVKLYSNWLKARVKAGKA